MTQDKLEQIIDTILADRFRVEVSKELRQQIVLILARELFPAFEEAMSDYDY